MHSPVVRARRVCPAVRAAGVARTVDLAVLVDPVDPADLAVPAVLVDLVVGTPGRVAPVVLDRVVRAVPIGTRAALAVLVDLVVPIGTPDRGVRVAPVDLVGTRAVRAAPVARATGVQGLLMPSVGGTTPRGAMERLLGVGERRRGSAGVVPSRLRAGFGTEAR